ncbi:metal ABC transporter permease [Chloroflexota bacterium]
MIEILHYSFMQRALVAAILVGILCSVIGVYVVLKRLSFIGVGVSHSAFGGVALGFLLGLNPIAMAIPFCLAVALGIGFTSKKGRVSEDAAIGILFIVAMALGVIFVGLAPGYNVDLFGYLFGSILAVSAADLWTIAILGLLVIGIVILLYKELLFLSFDEEMAKVSGLPVEKLYYLLLCLLAVTVVISIRIVGIILVSALLILPAATAFQLTRNFRFMMLLSACFGVLSGIAGLLLSYWFDLPSGATIILTASLVFILSLLLSARRRRTLRIEGA